MVAKKAKNNSKVTVNEDKDNDNKMNFQDVYKRKGKLHLRQANGT